MSAEVLEVLNPFNWALFALQEAAWLAVGAGGRLGRLGKFILCRITLV